MNYIWTRIQEEPMMVMTVIQGGIGLFTAFGLGLTGEQVGAIMFFSGAILSFITRKMVTPNTKL